MKRTHTIPALIAGMLALVTLTHKTCHENETPFGFIGERFDGRCMSPSFLFE